MKFKNTSRVTVFSFIYLFISYIVFISYIACACKVNGFGSGSYTSL